MSAPYHRPRDLSVALDLLASGGLSIAAGCTDLFPATERKHLPGAVLDLTGIAGLRGIKVSEAGVRIGATTTWSDLLETSLPGAFDGLRLAAQQVGARQIQNQATIVGNLCNASPAADGVPPLLTLDAVIEIQSKTAVRQVALDRFIKGPRHVDLQQGEMVTAILIPSAALGGASHFSKLGARDYLVISIAMTAARVRIEEGVVMQAALAIGSCGPKAVRLNEVEQRMIGKPFDPSIVTDEGVATAISPITDMRATADYRRHSAAELMRRTLAVLGSNLQVMA